MNEEKLKQILDKISQADVPDDITKIAGQTSKSFTDALHILQSQKQRQGRFVIGFRILAAAAVIVIAFAAGRFSNPASITSPYPRPAAYVPATSAYSIHTQNTDSFWQQKVLAATQPRPYAQSANLANQLNTYKQYLKEKYND
jgi:hypothetical protein